MTSKVSSNSFTDRSVITEQAIVDGLFEQWRDKISGDWLAYRNHVYRVLNFVNCLTDLSETEQNLVAVAAAFHDVSIWLDKTFDYLEPSQIRAQIYLKTSGMYVGKELEENQKAVAEMILNHHRIRPLRGQNNRLQEAFRKADWCDVSFGRLRYGIPKAEIKSIQSVFPDEGFHLLLVKLTANNAAQNPLNPLPMMRW